jgi:hypothetical protein
MAPPGIAPLEREAGADESTAGTLIVSSGGRDNARARSESRINTKTAPPTPSQTRLSRHQPGRVSSGWDG